MTPKQWVLAWVKSGVILAAVIALFLFVGRFVPALWAVILMALLPVAIAVLAFIFFGRTFGLVMLVIFPSKKALDVDFSHEGVRVMLTDSGSKLYPWDSILKLGVTENFDGIYISSTIDKQQYAFPQTYIQLEERIDAALKNLHIDSFKKETTLLDSNQEDDGPRGHDGKLETIFYTKK